jgi:hypothetical protein
MMKGIIAVAIGIVLLCVCAANGQQTQIYDYSYRGPTNYYGQPSYQPYGQPQGQGSQPGAQQPVGIIPGAFNQLHQAGSYLWSYMPAPVRGVPPADQLLQSKPEQVIINFVPPGP